MATPDPSPAAVGAELDRILASATFKNAERLRQFLRFVVEETLRDPQGTIKEHWVAVNVFERPESFDPRSDSVVRIAARQLRFKLRDYYEAEGRDDELVVDLPKGSYVPVVRKRERTGSARRRPPLRYWMAAVAASLVLAGLAAYLALRVRRPADPPLTAVAVLPFQSLGADVDLQYLSSGFVDELTGELSRTAGLRVVARTSASQFGGARDVGALGRRLNAGAVVEGSLRRDGDRIRISAQLIATADGYHLWARNETVAEREMPASAESIAFAMTRALAARTGARLDPGSPRTHSADPQALRLYWKGRYLRGQRRADAFREAAECFEGAVARDPDFAAAWAALADVEATMSFHQVGGPGAEDALAKARAASEKAMQTDATIPEAYATRGFIEFFHDWAWKAAENDLQRALALNPSYAKAHAWYALLLLSQGRPEEAVRESTLAGELNPVASVVSIDLGAALYIARRYDDSTRFVRRVLATDPSYTPAHALLGMNYAARGECQRAIPEYERAIRGSERHSYLLGRLGYAYARLGRVREAQALIDEMLKAPDPAGVSLVHVAYVYVGLGQAGPALDLLEKACPRRDADAVFIGVEPVLDPLGKEPRFTALLARFGLPRP